MGNSTKIHWLDLLRSRGLIQDVSDEAKLKALDSGTAFYVGFDPTAKSLQLGNLVPLVVAVHLAQCGLQPVILFGGATGAIGDPSGKDKERTLLSREVLDTNISRQTEQVKKLFSSLESTPTFVNNYDWTKDVSVLEFLRDVGKHFTVNYMIAKEVVKSRLGGSGISFTEFSYMLLQSFDFAHLYENHDVKMQIGGSDQWGNITSGLELIRRKNLGDAGAFSFPLLTNSEGKKFGKSEDGAMWLDAEMTSPYRLHQFLYNVEDADSIKYLRVLTFLDEEEIAELETATKEAPEARAAQLKLADELTRFIHGEKAVDEVNRTRNVLFGGSFEGISEEQLQEVFQEAPSTEMTREEALELTVTELFTSSGLASSKGDAKRLISQGGGYINNVRLEDGQQAVKDCHLPYASLIVLRSGKKNISSYT